MEHRPEFYDNSRITSHRTCPRLYYWEHVRNLRQIGLSHKSDFGTVWSLAMDTLWEAKKKLNLPDEHAVALAFNTFKKEWTDLGHPLLEQMTQEELDVYGFYHEYTALEMLHFYLERRRSFLDRLELVATEWPFAVSVGIDGVYHTGKIDKIIRWEGSIWGLDHKTTGWYRKSGGFAPEWLDSWHIKSQPDAYLHAMKMDFGNAAKGILIDAALVHKTVREFALIPIEKDIGMVADWLHRTQQEIEEIRRDLKLLEEDQSDRDFMRAFPKRETSCVRFNKLCPYFGMCTSLANPAEDPDQVPMGFEVRRWEPFDEDKLTQLVQGKNNG